VSFSNQVTTLKRDVLPVELRYSRVNALAGVITLGVCILIYGSVFGWTLTRLPFDRTGHYTLAVLAAAGCLLFLGLLGVMVRRACDRSIKVLATGEGIHDFRDTRGMVPWHEVNDLRLEGKRTNLFLDMAVLAVSLHSGDAVFIQLTGLERKTAESYEAIRRLFENYRSLSA
jgi:hypothetical protein